MTCARENIYVYMDIYIDKLILMLVVLATLMFARTGCYKLETRLCISGGDARTRSADSALLYKLKARQTER